MANSIANYGSDVLSAWRSLPRPDRIRIAGWATWIAAATLLFARPLVQIMMLASSSSLHSHIPLVPFIAAYLLFINRSMLPTAGQRSFTGFAVTGAISAVAVATTTVLDEFLTATDDLTAMAFAYVGFVVAGGFLFLGRRWMAAAAFPIAFLLFMVPLPDAVVIALEDALVVASADVSAFLITATGTPMIRDGTIFTLPTIVLEVARECSGIRSTWVLFMTSVAASHMFLKSPWRRFVLVAFVLPLGIVRNGFRILTIALLCVHVGPHMIDSFIHHRGGPIFFGLSLVPLFLLLAWLRRRDRMA